MSATNIERAKAVAFSLNQNRGILYYMGCFDEEGLAKLQVGKAPTIRNGDYAGEIATVDHIFPRGFVP